MKTLITLFSLTLLSFGSSEHKNQINFNLQNLVTDQAECEISKTFVNPIIDKTTYVVKKQNFEKKIGSKELFLLISMDTLKENIPYKILRNAPTLKYSIRKIGNGNKVMFSVNSGLRKLPELNYSQSSGVYTENSRRQQGFENVTFPFKCKLSASINYSENTFNNIGALLNDFEIEIYEPGYWEISFKN